MSMEATVKEVRKAKKDDVVRYNGRICKITYVHPDKTVNLSAFKGAPFNSKFTPIADLEFANEDGSFALAEVEPEITIVKPAKAESHPERKLAIRPDESVIVFDYAALTIEARVVVQQKTNEIKERTESMRRTIGEIGLRLLEVKAHLNHGQWGAWLRTEFNWSDQTALNYMNQARLIQQIPNYLEFGDRLSETALTALASPSTPPTVHTEVIQVLQSRSAEEKLTVAETKQIISEHKALGHADDQFESSPQTESPVDTLSEETDAPISTVSQGRQKPKTNRTSDEESPVFDRCQTPPYALIPLIPYLLSSWTVWEPAAGMGRLVQALVPHVGKVIASDILTGDDFMKTDRADFDAIVTNPPYSRKYHWLARCYKLGKPFALLIPGESLFTKQAATYIDQFGVELIIPLPRVDFEMPNLGFEGDGSMFPVAWFTWGFNIGKPFSYCDISAEKKAFKESLKASAQ